MQLPVQSVGIVADDLTGACDTALQFFSPGTETRVQVMLPNEHQVISREYKGRNGENQVWAINTASRHSNPHEAQAYARRALALCRDIYGVDHFYKKIDSTLRGHIAQECLGMLDELKAQCAVIVPAYPAEGRRTVGGYQLVRGVPVEKTVVARDPLFPVRQSHVPTMLEQASRPEIVGHIPLSQVLHGAGPILVQLKELIGQGRKLVVIDATTNEDLEQIALAIEKARKYANVLPCGSSGLGRALANLWASDDPESTDFGQLSVAPLASFATPLLMIIGSNTDTTRQQLRKLIEHYAYYAHNSKLEVFELSPEMALGLVPVEDLLARIQRALGEQNTVVVSSAANEDSYQRTLAVSREHGIADLQASRLVQETLARISHEIAQSRPVKLLVSGGETTRSICDLMAIQELRVLAEIEASIPLMEDASGRWIVTKSGGFGSPMVLANAVRFIQQRETLSALNV